MIGNCLVPSPMAIDGVLAQTPPGKIAMFKVISIPSTVEDHFLGEAVYIHKGKVFDFMGDREIFMGDREIVGLRAEDLLFMSYVSK